MSLMWQIHMPVYFLLEAAFESVHHLGQKMSMNSVAKKFLTHHEVSAQEAIYRFMSLPLIQGSRQVFVWTDVPKQTTRLFKPIKLIEMLEEDDPDVYMVIQIILFILLGII